jgi:hypothetical protein
MKCTVVPLMDLSGSIVAEVLLYGWSAAELQCVPPPYPIHHLCRKYAPLVSSPFLLYDMEPNHA